MPEAIDLVSGYLEERGIDYEVVEHEQRFTAAAEARASGVEPANAAKDVVLRSGTDFILAVIPASERLDLTKVRELIDDEERPRLASEEEIADRFPRFEVGALPPFGPMHGIDELVDRRLLDHDRVLCAGGDHRHSVRVDPAELVGPDQATVADLCLE